MSARLCRWCHASLHGCLIRHVNSGRPCCHACDHGGPNDLTADNAVTNGRNDQ